MERCEFKDACATNKDETCETVGKVAKWPCFKPKQNPQAEQATASGLSELLTCPDCKADPREFCVINSSKARELHEKNHVTAECKMCGFTVALSTSGPITLIRKLWNEARS